MTDTIENIIGFSFVALIFGSLMVDTFCTWTWNKTYFTSGLLIFAKRIPVAQWHTNIPQPALFEKMLDSDWVASFTFKEIDELSYGFRETMFQFRLIRYTPLMHGLLTFDTDNRQVVVKGFANLYPLAFSLMWFGMLSLLLIFNWSSKVVTFYALVVLGAAAFFLLLTAILYWTQSSRFSKVASVAAESWTRKYVRDNNRA